MTDGLVIYNAIIEKMSFEQWFYKGKGYQSYVSLDSSTLVEVAEASKDSGAYDSYGEAYQGWTGKAFIVFKVLDGGQLRYFKKEGTVDSYLGISWDGKFSEAEVVEKTVTVYDYK